LFSTIQAELPVTRKGQSKAQLVEEVKVLRQRIEELERSEGHRKQMDAALGENGETLRTLVESINDVLYTLNKDGVITYISPVVKSMIGYDPSEIIGRPLWDIVYEEDLPLAKDHFQKIISSGRFLTGEYRLVDRFGKTRWMRASAKQALEGDRVVGVRGVATDMTKRKRAEERLHLLSQAVEGSSEGIALADLDGNVLFVNKAFADLHGYDVEEVIGKHFSIFHTPEQIGAMEEAHRQVLDIGKFIGEIWHVRRDGTVFPGLMHNSLLRGSRGRPIGIMATLRDMTDLKKAEEALRESETRYRTIFENTGAATLITEEDTTISMINTEYERFSGYTKEEIEGKTSWKQTAHPDDLERMLRYHNERRKNGGKAPTEYEFRFIDKEGNIKDTYIKLGMIPGTQRSVASLIDITSRKRAEEILRESEEKYRLLFSSETDAITLFDLETRRILDANDAAIELYGYSKNEFLNLTVDRISREKEKTEAGIAKAMDEGAIRIPLRWDKRKNGEVFPVEISAGVFEWRGRKLMCAIARDITERIKAEESMREHQAELERRVKERTADLTRAQEKLTSELKMRKEAMNNLLSYQDRLRSLASELTLTEERERRRIATYLHHNIGHALALARIRLDSLRSSISSPDIACSLDEATEIIKSTIEEVRSLTFELSPPVLHELGFEVAVDWLAEQFHKVNGISCTVACDDQPKPLDEDISIFLFQSVRELLVNIAKHSSASSAKITIQRDEDNILIKVEDDGVGFSHSIPDSYLQENGGFGLFSIRERFESIGGTMKIESQPGSGCCVTLLAPLTSGV
jgi:PAS domain S-box-containing protein